MGWAAETYNESVLKPSHLPPHWIAGIVLLVAAASFLGWKEVVD